MEKKLDLVALYGAASDMLVALRGCRDALCEARKQFYATGDYGHGDMMKAHCEIAREVIKKADGTNESAKY